MMKKDTKYALVGVKSSSNVPLHQSNYYWRWFATALGFTLFGTGSLVVCLSVLPLIVLFTKDKLQRSYRVKSVIRHTFRLYLGMLERLGVIHIDTLGLENLHHMKGKLVICNHPSLLDVVIIMSRLKNIQCVVNSKLWSNPFVGLIVRAADYIRNDTDPETFLSNCQHMLSRGENIIIFPEGTRTIPQQKIKMCRGVANLALWAKVDIQTLTLECAPIWLTKGSKWYDIPPRKIHFLLKAGPIFSYRDFANHPLRSIQARHFMRAIQQYYEGVLT